MKTTRYDDDHEMMMGLNAHVTFMSKVSITQGVLRDRITHPLSSLHHFLCVTFI